jgi:ribosomal protein L37AE/L43A
MYYDDFELDCGCRMHCGCDKALFCSSCQKTQVFRAGTYYIFYCRKCGSRETTVKR